LSSYTLFMLCSLFFSTAPPPPQLSTLSLHDALPILRRPAPHGRRLERAGPAGRRVAAVERRPLRRVRPLEPALRGVRLRPARPADRKSTRLNSSHQIISYAVFCLKKKNRTQITRYT